MVFEHDGIQYTVVIPSLQLMSCSIINDVIQDGRFIGISSATNELCIIPTAASRPKVYLIRKDLSSKELQIGNMVTLMRQVEFEYNDKPNNRGFVYSPASKEVVQLDNDWYVVVKELNSYLYKIFNKKVR